MKKYPPLLTLKNSTIFAKDPLNKILYFAQMNEYNDLYSKYFKNPLKLPGTKTPSFD